jgi:hypothetical protein
MITITKEEMIIAINDYLTGAVESATCSCAYPFDSTKCYVLFTDWFNAKGATVPELVVPGTVFTEGYHNHGKPVLPTFLQGIIDKQGANSTLLERMFRRIKRL